MLVFACLVPHSPILVPSIGQDNIKKLKKTVSALEDLEAKLYVAKPDVLVMISPHGESHENTTTLVLSEEYLVNFKELGDFSLNFTFKPSLPLVERFRRALFARDIPVATQHETPLNHGLAVPLLYLTKNLLQIKILPILPSHHDTLKRQFDIGYILKDRIMNDKARIAVIASADLSHKLSSDAPAGFSPKAKNFDDELQRLLETKNSAKILQIHHELMDEVEICGLRAVSMMLGMIDRVNTTTQIFSYEAPFGVGYLVANFKLH